MSEDDVSVRVVNKSFKVDVIKVQDKIPDLNIDVVPVKNVDKLDFNKVEVKDMVVVQIKVFEKVEKDPKDYTKMVNYKVKDGVN